MKDLEMSIKFDTVICFILFLSKFTLVLEEDEVFNGDLIYEIYFWNFFLTT